MWPRLLAQIVDLLPHASRLIPLADAFFASRLATDRATEATVAAIEDVRGDLGKVTTAHADLSRQLHDLSTQVTELSGNLRSSRATADQQQHSIEALEKQLTSLTLWIKGGIAVFVILAAVIIGLLLHLAHAR